MGTTVVRTPAPQKRKSGKEKLMDIAASFVDRAHNEMNAKELAAAEKKTDEFISSVRASLREKK